MITSTTHSRKNLGIILDQSYEDPLRPISSGTGLGNCVGCARPIGFAMPAIGTPTLIGLGLGIGAGLFLWKHKTGQKIVRRTKSALGLRGARRRRRHR